MFTAVKYVTPIFVKNAVLMKDVKTAKKINCTPIMRSKGMNKMNINLTRKPDRATITIDATLIDYLKPALGECEIYFVDGGSVAVYEGEKEIAKHIREAKG